MLMSLWEKELGEEEGSPRDSLRRSQNSEVRRKKCKKIQLILDSLYSVQKADIG